MNSTSSLTSPLQTLLPLLEHELKTGCQNASVFGGFDVHFLNSLDKIGGGGDWKLKTTILELKTLFNDYANRSIKERRQRIEQAKQVLTDIELPPEPPKTIDPLGFSAQYLKGVGPHVAQKLSRLGIETVRDLLTHYPRRHEDRRQLYSIKEATWGEMQTIRGRIGKIAEVHPRRKFTITKMSISDGTAVAHLIWYNQPYMKNHIKAGMEVIAYGKLERKFGELQIISPEIEVLSLDQETTLHTNRIVPIYPSTEALSQTLLRKTIFHALEKHKQELRETLPQELIRAHQLLSLRESIEQIHFPVEWVDLKKARRRLAFEEFLVLQIFLALKKRNDQLPKGISFAIVAEWFDAFEKTLPFSLTGAQKRVISEVVSDMKMQQPMHRLIQGDVGSGKTVVAAYAAFCAVKCGYQTAYMAPTEILAEQHGTNLSKILNPLGISTLKLIGDQTKSERDKVLRSLQTGSGKLVIGTHAIIQDDVFFNNLGLCIIDEQHKFGVMQRTSLKQKGNHPDILVMTATPIPRTLAMTLYGDLDVSVIDEMPVGRKGVKTTWLPMGQQDRAWSFVRKEVAEGRQAFVVCPLVDDSDKLDAVSAIREAERLKAQVFSDIPVELLHGRMKSDEKEAVMEAFRQKRACILIATTVIEVGVDIPDATVMVIQNAERFGLSQLHQLRGRVGRSEHQAYCILLAEAKSEEARERLQVMCQSNDGFAIAEQDLRLRGPGEFYGTRQHGLPDLKIADLIHDLPLLEEARKTAFDLISSDPRLEKPEHQPLRQMLRERFDKNPDLI